MSEEFAIRPMETRDKPFVYSAFLEGYWSVGAGGAALIMRKSEWLPRWHRVIERLLEAGVGLVAHVDGKPESLLGFAASGHGCLHWAYVKQPFRGLGIATEMIRNFKLNEQVGSLWSPKLVEHGWRYDPRFLGGFGA